MPQDPAWLPACYLDESPVTQIAGTIAPGDVRGLILHEPTSSSTLPSLVLRMLDDLGVEDGMHVLEIGTGTGYSTALLCRRLGDDLVTSVEVDPNVAAKAATALAQAGHVPYLVTGDGLAGHPDNAPYDRIIATCGVRTTPTAWLAQTRPGGQILAPLSGWMGSSDLARLTVHDNGTATGPPLGGQVSFMLARPQSTPGARPAPGHPHRRRAGDITGADVLDDWTARFIAQTAAPHAQHLQLGDGEHLLVDVEAGAWALLHRVGEQWRVRQGGPARLWEDIGELIVSWRHDGALALEQFQITVTADGHHTYTWPR